MYIAIILYIHSREQPKIIMIIIKHYMQRLDNIFETVHLSKLSHLFLNVRLHIYHG